MANVRAVKATVNIGSVGGGSLSETFVQDAVYYNIIETTGSPATEVIFDFTVASTATSFFVFGRYQGNAGHNVNVDAWNGNTWDTIDTWPHSAADSLTEWALDAGHTISGNVRVRVQHTSPGNITHDFWFDYVYVTGDTPERMILDDGAVPFNFSPAIEPPYNRQDSRQRGHFQARDGERQYWQTGGAQRHVLTLNDIPKSQADMLNDWWRDLTILTYTPNTNSGGTTIFARVSPGGQAPLQMWFDTGFQNRYAGTITIVEVSSSSSGS